ncbi:Ig-like domain-containing protein [Mucilaginibacter auburnensis]|uniref:Ig-like domain-containing protein n=1 Tax=Mucilaginibacter auburnensis TaxID=1457233 RepID=A0A2H9VRC7_9SPHI|nr:Ig-like domain-containing protein [Mucilaginibacter auburnensis]PJJ83372.1 Ig-like domain-containing protein [Mucilaginibacter auburnensis]
MSNAKSQFFGLFKPLILALFALSGCAVQQKPQGGPRDKEAPKLLLAVPKDQTRNFTGKKIELTFDEYFKLNNQYQEISISPAQERLPEFTVKQKTLQIELKDTLQKNTTYVINFGKAIVDVNEGNQVKNFTYVFSTGPSIDSLTISGNVFNAITQTIEKEATVMLFNLQQDSLLFGKKKPALFTTTDTAGNFKFSNLKADNYRIYALKEQSGDKIYNNDGELVAFKANPIRLTKDTTGIKLTLFKEVPDKLRYPNRAFDPAGAMFVSTNRPLNRPSVKILSPEALDVQKVVEINKTADSIHVYSKNMDFDSLKLALYEAGKPFDTLTFKKGRKETYQRNFTLGYNITPNGTIKPGTDLIITGNMPIDTYTQSAMTLMEDSAKVNFQLQRDTSTQKRLILKYRFKPKAKYTLTFNEGSLVDIFGDKLKRTQKIFSLDNAENYSELTMRIAVPDTGKSYIIELLTASTDQKNVVRTQRITRNTAIVYKMLLAGKYQLRVSYDANKNGKWDTGSVSRKTQPENVWLNPTIYTIRPNWSDEQTIQIPPEPPIAP